jgi:UDP-2-acetamido-3-amino-2,3-dideoxy-glucuronate N-acetyltransferase
MLGRNKGIKVAGVPARQIGWACKCSAKLEFEGEYAVCKEYGRRYRKQGDRVILLSEE